MSNVVEQRRHERHAVDSVEIFGKMVLTRKVKLLDISISGAAVEVDRRLNMGAEYQVKLGRNGSQLDMKGKVVWSSLVRTEDNGKGDMAPVYRAGLEFGLLSSGQTETLARFIGECSGRPHSREDMHRQNNLRCTMRYRVAEDGGGTAALESRPEYRVQVISLGGMLLLCDRPFREEERHPMRIEGPDGKAAAFTGRIAYCTAAEGGYEVGVEFLDLGSADRQCIEQFITLANGDYSARS